MLVLSRQRDESVIITVPGQPEIEVSIVAIRGDKVRLGLTAAKEITIHRKEVVDAIKREQKAASEAKK